MSEAEFTGYQFNHPLNDPIDPRLQHNDQVAQGSQIHYARFNQEFDHDVEQAVRAQNEPGQWPSTVEDIPITPTNLSPARPSLNPRATEFHPQPLPNTGYLSGGTEPFEHPELTGTQLFPPYFVWPNQVQGNHFNHLQHQQWHNPAGFFNVDQPLQQENVANSPVLGSPFSPNHQNAHDAGHDTSMAVSSENVAHIPRDQNLFQTMHQWNQDTYQGPLAHPLQSQLPPTPVSIARRRRGGSVAASTRSLFQNFPCNTCEKTFIRKCDLKHHQRWHNKPVACTICDMPFSAKKDLQRHVKAIHDKAEKHLFCNILGCNYPHGFGRVDHLKRHHARKHPGYPWSPPATSVGGG